MAEKSNFVLVSFCKASKKTNNSTKIKFHKADLSVWLQALDNFLPVSQRNSNKINFVHGLRSSNIQKTIEFQKGNLLTLHFFKLLRCFPKKSSSDAGFTKKSSFGTFFLLGRGPFLKIKYIGISFKSTIPESASKILNFPGARRSNKKHALKELFFVSRGSWTLEKKNFFLRKNEIFSSGKKENTFFFKVKDPLRATEKKIFNLSFANKKRLYTAYFC